LSYWRKRMSKNSSVRLKLLFVSIGIIIGLFSSLVIFGYFMKPYHDREISAKIKIAGVSWAYYFPSLRALATNSDAIVLGKVIDAGIVYNPLPSFPGEAKEEYVKTTYKFKVERVIKGDLSVGEIISINQSGGIINGTYVLILVNGRPAVVEDAFEEGLPSKVGDQLILFLRRIRGTSRDFAIQGPPAGRFIVSSNKVYSLNIIYPYLKETMTWKYSSINVNGTDLEEFIREIQSSLEQR